MTRMSYRFPPPRLQIDKLYLVPIADVMGAPEIFSAYYKQLEVVILLGIPANWTGRGPRRGFQC